MSKKSKHKKDKKDKKIKYIQSHKVINDKINTHQYNKISNNFNINKNKNIHIEQKISIAKNSNKVDNAGNILYNNQTQ